MKKIMIMMVMMLTIVVSTSGSTKKSTDKGRDVNVSIVVGNPKNGGTTWRTGSSVRPKVDERRCCDKCNTCSCKKSKTVKNSNVCSKCGKKVVSTVRKVVMKPTRR